MSFTIEKIGAATKITDDENAATLIPSNTVIVAGTDDNLIRIFSSNTGHILFEIPFDEITDQQGQPDAKSLADFYAQNGFFFN